MRCSCSQNRFLKLFEYKEWAVGATGLFCASSDCKRLVGNFTQAETSQAKKIFTDAMGAIASTSSCLIWGHRASLLNLRAWISCLQKIRYSSCGIFYAQKADDLIDSLLQKEPVQKMFTWFKLVGSISFIFGSVIGGANALLGTSWTLTEMFFLLLGYLVLTVEFLKERADSYKQSQPWTGLTL